MSSAKFNWLFKPMLLCNRLNIAENEAQWILDLINDNWDEQCRLVWYAWVRSKNQLSNKYMEFSILGTISKLKKVLKQVGVVHGIRSQ